MIIPRRASHARMPRWAYDLELRLDTLIKTTKEQIVSNLGDAEQNLDNAISAQGAAITQEIQQLKDALDAGGQVTQADLDRLAAATQRLTDSTASLQADDATPPTP